MTEEQLQLDARSPVEQERDRLEVLVRRLVATRWHPPKPPGIAVAFRDAQAELDRIDAERGPAAG